jgi:pseudouridine-5'-phosphate glycosidase
LALESTVITHGLPWPENLAIAQALEQTVRELAVIPATVAVLHGKLCVGLEQAALEELARLGPAAEKCSRRDLSLVLQSGRAAGTTVAATLMIAAMAGIRVFATGGLGGVHRGASKTFDISADLQELARTPVAVVCSGPKAILDLGLTLEYLETRGVPVIGYQTDQLPAFYSRDSGLPVDKRLDTVAEIAQLLNIHWSLGLGSLELGSPGMGGVVIANPVPADMALDRETTELTISNALDEADKAGISGKALTPWLLARLETLTAGKSLLANKALLLGNARLGARIAAALNQLQLGRDQ